jgi:hypothetical protein
VRPIKYIVQASDERQDIFPFFIDTGLLYQDRNIADEFKIPYHEKAAGDIHPDNGKAHDLKRKTECNSCRNDTFFPRWRDKIE